MKCIKCQNEIHEQSSFCAKCGQQVPRCPTCNALLRTRARFCAKDGTQIPNEILALIPERNAPEQKRFCARCGRPCRAGQKLCDACMGSAAVRNAPPQKPKKQNNLVFILIPILLLLLALIVGGCYALSNELIDPLGWIENLSFSQDAEEKEPAEDEEEEPEETKETKAPAAESPAEGPSEETEIATTEASANPLASLNVGDTFFFGSYEQDNVIGNGQEPIEWIVLEKESDRIMVISKQLLDSIRYHQWNENVTWETCDARIWLNTTFYNTAFTTGEQAQILTASDLYGTLNDKVFLLSTDEAVKYFPENSDRICWATKYAVARNAYVNASTRGSWWLLRTPGIDNQHVVSVNSDGSIDYTGGQVSNSRGTVRPVIWINIG